MRVLVCGSRDWADRKCIHSVLDGLFNHEQWPFAVIEGCAAGADSAAGEWAEKWTADAMTHLRFPADWSKHGKRAGPIRNQQMLDEGKPDVVWAFVSKPLAESRGTADMVRRSVAAGIPTYVVQAILRYFNEYVTTYDHDMDPDDLARFRKMIESADMPDEDQSLAVDPPTASAPRALSSDEVALVFAPTSQPTTAASLGPLTLPRLWQDENGETTFANEHVDKCAFLLAVLVETGRSFGNTEAMMFLSDVDDPSERATEHVLSRIVYSWWSPPEGNSWGDDGPMIRCGPYDREARPFTELEMHSFDVASILPMAGPVD